MQVRPRFRKAQLQARPPAIPHEEPIEKAVAARQNQNPDHQRMDAPAVIGGNDRRDGAGKRRDHLDNGDAPEGELLFRQHLDLLAERQQQERQAGQRKGCRQIRFAVKTRDPRAGGPDRAGQQRAGSDIQPIERRQGLARNRAGMNDRIGHAEIGKELNEGRDGQDHRHQAEILRRDQPGKHDELHGLEHHAADGDGRRPSDGGKGLVLHRHGRTPASP